MSSGQLHRVRIGKVTIRSDWKPSITDHALLRYIERVHGVDMEALREHLRSDALRRAIIRGAAYVEREDCTLVIVDDRVVTVLAKGKRPRLSEPQRQRRMYELQRRNAIAPL